jgi:hypothetical protein
LKAEVQTLCKDFFDAEEQDRLTVEQALEAQAKIGEMERAQEANEDDEDMRDNR